MTRGLQRIAGWTAAARMRIAPARRPPSSPDRRIHGSGLDGALLHAIAMRLRTVRERLGPGGLPLSLCSVWLCHFL
jgi:hypothetical protein